MKIQRIQILILMLSGFFFNAGAQNIAGIWQGVLTQENAKKALSNSYAVWMKVQQNGYEITGFVRIEVANTGNFAILEMEGSCSNNFFGFIERKVFSEHFDNQGFQWCMIAGRLNVDSNATQLNGTWLSTEKCGSGSLNLIRTDQMFNFDFPQSNDYIEMNDIKSMLKQKSSLKNKKVIIEDLHFESGSAMLDQHAEKILKDVLKLLQNNPDLKIKILGHTDNVGDIAMNLRLSLKRAQAVKTYLINNGIAADRLAVEGFGSGRPLDRNDTEAGRAKNRRTEIEIL